MIFLKQNRAFGQLAVIEVLAYFDGPRLFLASAVTLKAATYGHFKTGHFEWAKT